MTPPLHPADPEQPKEPPFALPLKVAGEFLSDHIMDAERGIVIIMDGPVNDPKTNAQRDYVIAAVNLFEEMREAMHDLLKRINAISEDDDGCLYINGREATALISPLDKAFKVLAKAEAVKP